MDTLKIPNFDNEADEANWAYDNRKALRRRSCKLGRRARYGKER
jgi:hypothetical protein